MAATATAESVRMTCAYCDQPVIVTPRPGRPRSYCSDACRARRWQSVCRNQKCSKQAQYQCDGYCKAHYRKSLQAQPAWTMYDELHDLLSVDGGWLTSTGLAADTGRANVDAIERVLRRLRADGLVESRIVEMAWSKGGYERRTEWRAV